MNKEDTKYFMLGLKKVIDHEWTTQEEFARNVCSAVNLSNVLRGNSGTSPSMRQALAGKAGRSSEELVSIGKYGYPVKDSVAESQWDAETMIEGIPFTTNSLAEATTEDMLQMINGFISETTDHVSERLKNLTVTMNLIVKERNRLAKIVQKYSTMFNASGDAVKVVNKNLIITECNRAYTQHYHKYIGDSCNSDCSACDGENCIVTKVFTTALPERTITCTDGKWFSHIAYPIFSTMNTVDKVVVISRELEEFLNILEDQGWTRPDAYVTWDGNDVSLSTQE
jgi:transcriptional regulator with PAS, ATPase and Fis domain